MDLRHLTTFLTISRLGSFVKAAAELNYAQSTITLHVQELEKELQAPLFHRARGAATLTEAGQVLQRHATRIVGEVDGLRQSVADLLSGDGGRVLIGVMEPTASLRLAPILTRFYQDRPGVELSVEVGGAHVIIEGVARGELDFGICSPPAARHRLAFDPLFRERMALLVPAGHAFADAGAVTGDQLEGRRLLVTEETCAYREAYERALAEAGVTLPPVNQIGSVRALISAVQAGLGVAVVPVSGVSPPPPRTVLRQLLNIEMGLTIGIVRRSSGPPLGRAAETLLSYVQESLRSGGDQHGDTSHRGGRRLARRKSGTARS